MRTRTPLLIATVAAVAVALVPGQAAAAPASDDAHTGAIPTAASGLLADLDYDAVRAQLSPEEQARLDAVIDHFPAGWQERLATFRSELGIEPSAAEQAVMRAIDPSLYECQPTAFSEYTSSLLEDIDLTTLLIMLFSGMLNYPVYDAIVYGTPDNTDDYGLSSMYKPSVHKVMRKSQKFWDVDLSDVQAIAMRNDMLLDHARVTRVIELLFPQNPDGMSSETATILIDLVRTAPGLDGGRNPIFTLNAFAFTSLGETDPVLKNLPDKIVFGEGLGKTFDLLGLGTTGAKAVVSHEMAHHVQYEQGYFESPLTGPEATRRTELMADAFGTFFVAHKRGLNLTGARLATASQSFYEVGDCSFSSDSHHGTPNQRMKASVWGAGVAHAAPPPFRVLPSDTLYDRFERQLPIFLLPDAEDPAA